MFTPWKKFSGLLMMLYLVAACTAVASGQKPPKEPKTPHPLPVPGEKPPGFFNHDDERESFERSSSVDPNVSVKLCVSQGDLKINGWKRNEVRVFVKNGRNFMLKALEKSPESGQANWLQVVNDAEGRPGYNPECLAGDRIEIDAPLGASFDLTGRAARTSVDSIKKIKVKIVEGGASFRNIPGGITAYTGQGDVIVENSGGSIALETTTGNIIAVEVSPGQIGEQLRAKTNSGAISFQRVVHRQIEASSISGTVTFEGKFLDGGIYSFRTSNGAIRLSIPAGSSCMIRATYGYGEFQSDFPFKILTENVTPNAKMVTAQLGEKASTAANLTLTTSSGSINIKKAGSAAIP